MAGVPLPEWVHDVSDGAELLVRLTPRAGSNAVAGVRAGRLQLRVTAAPEDGKANAAACKLLAKRLRIGKSCIVVTRGQTARDKTIRVRDTSARELADALAT